MGGNDDGDDGMKAVMTIGIGRGSVEVVCEWVGAEDKGTNFLKNVQTRFPEMLRNIFDSSP